MLRSDFKSSYLLIITISTFWRFKPNKFPYFSVNWLKANMGLGSSSNNIRKYPRKKEVELQVEEYWHVDTMTRTSRVPVSSHREIGDSITYNTNSSVFIISRLEIYSHSLFILMVCRLFSLSNIKNFSIPCSHRLGLSAVWRSISSQYEWRSKLRVPRFWSPDMQSNNLPHTEIINAVLVQKKIKRDTEVLQLIFTALIKYQELFRSNNFY